MGGQASWLLPAALLALVVGLWSRGARRAPIARARRCFCGVAGCSSPAASSASEGVIHTYYTVALAPAIAALVAIGARPPVAATATSPSARGSRVVASR